MRLRSNKTTKTMLTFDQNTQTLIDQPDPATLLLKKPKVNKEAKKREEQARLMTELMDMKKKRDADNHQRSKLFLAIGFTLSLLMVIVAFEWKTYDNGELMDLGTVKADFDEIADIELTQQPPPPPPTNKIIQPVFKEVPDDVELEELETVVDVEMTEDLAIEEVVYEEVEMEEEMVEEIFSIVETQPEPVGGLQEFYKYVSDNLDYPLAARKMGVGGKVFVRFVVEKDGSITNVEVIRGIGHGCDEEAIRVIANAPDWKPGKQRGNPVRVYAMVPIFFIFRD